MKRSLFLLLILLLLAGCSAAMPTAVAPAEPTATSVAPASVDTVEGTRTFVVVPEESTASYRVNEEFFAAALRKYNIPIGKKVTVGSTHKVAGTLTLNLNAGQPLGPSQFTVDLPSLTSDQRLRDGWIRKNALESNTYPQAIFVASAVEGAPASYTEGDKVQFQLLGDLTVRSISLPVTFDVTATLHGDTIQGVAETEVKMSDFGVTPPNFAGTLVVTDLFTIHVELTAREQN